MSLQDKLTKFQEEMVDQIKHTSNLQELDNLRVQIIGKKGTLTDILRGMKDLEPSQRPVVGGLANQIRDNLTDLLSQRKAELEQAKLQEELEQERLDVTLPGRIQQFGNSHILTKVITEIEDLFISMGFDVVDGYEIESDVYNFERMNLPKHHPARDMQDTFYIDDDYLLRTHTSPIQARVMENHDFNEGPLKIICPGKVYRRDTDDATHSHQFHQLEGLLVGENITMSDLKGMLTVILEKIFGEEREVRLRPSYFPFTEPSVELDISCFKCGGSGCSVCKKTGWIEVLGAGMVHPNVLEMSGIDSNKYSGFAFGIGPDRIAMLKYGVNDIRNFYTNDIRFLDQFIDIKED